MRAILGPTILTVTLALAGITGVGEVDARPQADRATGEARPSRAERTRAVRRARAKAPRRREKTYIFSAHKIDGNRIGPDGMTLWGRQSAEHPSLIQLRDSFVPQIVRTAEKLH